MKIFEGTVVSLKMQNTAVVEVLRKVPHPLYKKMLKRNKKHQADTAGLSLTIGDKVKIVEVRPISKEKHFKVMEKIK
jgi:small subunit ribosomal protein S17